MWQDAPQGGTTSTSVHQPRVNHEAETVYPKEQILVFETSNGMIDNHVGDPMQAHVPRCTYIRVIDPPRFQSPWQRSAATSTSRPKRYTVILDYTFFFGSGQALPTNSNATSIDQWLVALRVR